MFFTRMILIATDENLEVMYHVIPTSTWDRIITCAFNWNASDWHASDWHAEFRQRPSGTRLVGTRLIHQTGHCCLVLGLLHKML